MLFVIIVVCLFVCLLLYTIGSLIVNITTKQLVKYL